MADEDHVELIAEYDRTATDYARAVGQLRRRIGTTSLDEYDTSESRRRGAAELRSSASSSPTLYRPKR
jgi:hypothetical protein